MIVKIFSSLMDKVVVCLIKRRMKKIRNDMNEFYFFNDLNKDKTSW